jgi:hypothetical protein
MGFYSKLTPVFFLLGQCGCLIRDCFFFGVHIRRWERSERLLGFSPSQGELVAAHYPFKKAVNGFVAGFKTVLLFQAARYFWPRVVTPAHGPDQVDVFPERARIGLALHLSLFTALFISVSLFISLYLSSTWPETKRDK